MKLFRHLFALACLLFVSLPALADNKISVDPVNIANNDVVKIPVVLTNTDPIAAVQFNIQLPEFLEYAGTPERNSDRFAGHTLDFENNFLFIYSLANKPFKGNEGTLFYLPVKVKAGTPAGTEGQIGITNIVLSGPGGGLGQTAPRFPQDDFSTDVKFNNAEVAFSFEPSELDLKPGTTTKVNLNFKANCDIFSMEATFTLPEGITIGDDVAVGDVCPNTGVAMVTTLSSGNGYKILYLSTDNETLNANEGTLLSFDVVASEAFAAESAEIRVSNIIATYTTSGKFYEAPDLTIAVTSSVAAYSRLMEALTTVETTLNQVLDVIDDECKDVKDKYTGEEYFEQIAGLKTKIEESYAAGTLKAEEKALEDEIAALGEAILKMNDDAQQAQRDFEADAKNNDAYDRMMAQVKMARGSLADMLDAIATDCPNVKDRFTGDEITAKIDAIEADINRYKEEGVCAFEEDGINERIAALATDLEDLHAAAVTAEEQFKADQLEADNKAAHEAMIELLGIAQQSYTDMIEAIATDCSHVADQFKGEEIATKIATLAGDIEKYNEEGTCVDNLEDVKARVAAIGEDLAALKAAADLAEEEYKSNMSVYDTMKDQVTVARQTLADALAAIAEDCPDVKEQFTGEEITEMIDALEADIEKFNTEGTCADNVEAVNERIAAIGEAIAQLQADATAAEENFKSEQLQVANQAAYDRVNTKLEASRAALAAAVAEIAASYPNIREQFTGEEITADIDEVAAELTSLYEQWLCAEEEEALNAKVASIDQAIAGYVGEAKAAQEKYELDLRNKVAYDIVNAQLDALQAELDAAVALVNETYPDAPVQSYIYTAQGAINDAREAADEAYDAATENGTTFNYTLDADTIKALIAEIEEAAKMLGISEIFGDDIDASSFCDVFTTDGRLVLKEIPVAEIREHLAQGFYIVLVNGKSFKLAIK